MTLDEPPRRKKKKRQRPAPEPASTAREEGSDAAEERSDAAEERSDDDAQQKDVDVTPAPPALPSVEAPRFTRSFPRDEALDDLVAAFERGDYAFVRTEAPALARRTTDPEVRRAALELRRRIDPDKLSLLLIAFAFALLVVLAFFYWTNKHS